MPRSSHPEWSKVGAQVASPRIATALALPFNTAFSGLVDVWVAQHPIVTQVLGPDASSMLAAPISAPIVEEVAKALGVLAIF